MAKDSAQKPQTKKKGFKGGPREKIMICLLGNYK